MSKSKNTPPRKFQAPKGLKVNKVLDVAGLVNLRSKFETPMSMIGTRERELRSLINDSEVKLETPLNDEEHALIEARKWAQKVIAEDERVRQTLGSMIAFRRCYAVAYRELQEALTSYHEAPGMGEDYLVQAGMHQAAQPFNEHTLMQGFVDTVLPWIATVVDKHVDADEEAEKIEDELEEKERKDRPIPLGFLLDLDTPDPTLNKERSLVLAGWSNAVRFVLDQIMNTVLVAREGQTFCVVRLYQQAPTGKDENRLLIRLAPNIWEGCTDRNFGVPKMMGSVVAPRLTQPVDLLICDHLPLAFKAGFIGRPASANAGDAHKRLRIWCNTVKAGLVGGILLDEKDIPDLSKPEYEQLKTFANLRAVRVIPSDEEGHVRVNVVGSLHNWEVEEKVLASYGRSEKSIIV